MRLRGTVVADCVEQLYSELADAGLRFRPHVWISDEWFSPDGVPGFALPFFLLHPRLIRLEQSMVDAVEGGSHAWCMKLLRHETGHALENAFRTRRLKERRLTFGKSSQPYPTAYLPRRYSRDFVIHLEEGYAQVVVQPDLLCGVGACLACVVPTASGVENTALGSKPTYCTRRTGESALPISWPGTLSAKRA